MSPKFRYVSIVSIFALGLAGTVLVTGPCRAESSPYVAIKDRQFQLEGRPYRFVGVNYWYAALLGMKVSPGDRQRLCRELDKLASLGLKNLRVLAMAERTTASPLDSVTQSAPGQYSDAWWDGLDFAVSEMDKRGIKAVLCLTNYWNWSGGIAQYYSWAGGGPVVPDDGGWVERNEYVIKFYSNPAAQHLLENSVDALITRRNRYSGKLYTEDPTIMTWQLCNEARPGADARQTKAVRLQMVAWLKSLGAHVRSLGVHQLVTSGCEGVFGCNGDEDLFRRINALPEIDYVTAHLWPQNWLWYDPKRAKETFEPALARCVGFLKQHTEIATDLGKPLVVEEFGLARDGGTFAHDAKTTYRDRFLSMVGETWLASVKSGSAFQGFNVWTWSGEGRPRDDTGAKWQPGYPIVGENPNEEQGWYSVNDTDRETVAILQHFAFEASKIPPDAINNVSP